MSFLKLLNRSVLSSLNNTSRAVAFPSSPAITRLLQHRFESQNAQSSPDSASTNKTKPPPSRTDMEELFLDIRVRNLLKRLTGYNPAKLFISQSLENMNSPQYRFMTDEQLRMEKEKADQTAEKKLQMPPIKYAKHFEPRILEEDAALQGFLDPSLKLIFMDATPGYSDVERLIVVREANGVLREATRDERHRANQIFYPLEEREIEFPKMFHTPENTLAVLNRGGYKVLLDNACLHFEPEDQRYIDYCHQTYEHIASKYAFDALLSTRHYGGMVFYYVFNKRIDPLLNHLITENQLENACHILQLYYIVNPRKDVPVELNNEALMTDVTMTQLAELTAKADQLVSITLEQFINLLKFYITNDSTNELEKAKLQLNLQKIQGQLLNELENSAAAQN